MKRPKPMTPKRDNIDDWYNMDDVAAKTAARICQSMKSVTSVDHVVPDMCCAICGRFADAIRAAEAAARTDERKACEKDAEAHMTCEETLHGEAKYAKGHGDAAENIRNTIRARKETPMTEKPMTHRELNALLLEAGINGDNPFVRKAINEMIRAAEIRALEWVKSKGVELMADDDNCAAVLIEEIEREIERRKRGEGAR